jgi:hypothetical protein
MGKVIEAFRKRAAAALPQPGPYYSCDGVYDDIAMGNGWISGAVQLQAGDGLSIELENGKSISIDSEFSDKIDLLLSRQEKIIHALTSMFPHMRDKFKENTNDGPGDTKGPERVLDPDPDVCFTVSPRVLDDATR